MKRFFANAEFKFIEMRRKAYVLSGSALFLCVAAMLFWHFLTSEPWVNYGVDFAGGTLVQVQFEAAVDVAELRPLLEPGFPGTEITRFGQENEFLIRAPQMEGNAASAADAITALLTDRYGEEGFATVRTEAVGAKVGGELQRRAALAIILSFIATLIYLAFRFEWRFGLAAVIAAMHDIIITLGVISALRLEVALPMVAAVLTIVGYSLNDTIVIFDRIRENLQGPGRRREMIGILNRSINETLPRTVLTSGTTLATLLALFIFGGVIIREFALILIVGIVLGTYSSIFVAAPALLEIQTRWPHEQRKRSKAAKTAKATA